MNQQQFAVEDSNKKNKPQGQLAAMLQSRGWDDYSLAGGEINRSSSAPPTQLRMQNNVSFLVLF
jgi:hypothetical protein